MTRTSLQGQKVKGQGHTGGGILWRPPAQLVIAVTSVVVVAVVAAAAAVIAYLYSATTAVVFFHDSKVEHIDSFLSPPKRLCFHCVCLFACVTELRIETTEPISIKFRSRKNPLHFGGNPDHGT